VKKILFGILVVGFLVGCSTDAGDEPGEEKTEVAKEENKDSQPTSETEVKQEESKYPFPTNATPVGDAKLTVSTPAGNSSDGNAPVLFVQPDDLIIQIGADFENFQGDKQTFIYIDKIFSNTDQVGELSQTSLDLSENLLKPGLHTVTAVQFENDDPSSPVINFIEAQYEVKESK
jgi:hypothetical protein